MRVLRRRSRGLRPSPERGLRADRATRDSDEIYGNVRTLYPDVTPAEAAEVMLPHSDDGHQDPDAAFRTAAKIDERTAP